jgi:putative transposase
MAEYRRYFVAGGTYFFTIVTYRRRPLFADRRNVQRLRDAIGEVKRDQPFEIQAAVVLPDHLHFIWTLPPGDDRYSKRIGRIKVLFTRSWHDTQEPPQDLSLSRRKHRESDVWQRRFWEHVIRDEREFERCLDYLHYNPVKHGLATCPHLWEASSFCTWVQRGLYEPHWGCCCEGRDPGRLAFPDVEMSVGE